MVAQPSSCLQVCQMSMSGKSCPDYHDFGTHYYIPDHWHFLLLHKADLGDLGTISSPAWMGWRGAKQSFHFPYSLIYAMHLPHWYLQRRHYFLQILKLLAGYFQRSMLNFTQNYTVLSQETLSLRLDAYVLALSYSLIPPILFSVRNTSCKRINHVVFKMLYSIYIYSILLHTHSFFTLSVWKKIKDFITARHSARAILLGPSLIHGFSWFWFLIHLFHL